jgi:hypothetical protein
MQSPEPVEAGVLVEIIAGAGQGSLVFTDTGGIYRLQLPRGPFRLRWSKRGFQPAESAEQVVDSGNHVSMPEVLLKTAAWVITGVVTDSRDTPVADTIITIDIGGAFFVTGSTRSGPDGRYRFASAYPHYDLVGMGASHNQVESWGPESVECCDAPADTVQNIRLVRIGNAGITGPTTLRVVPALVK